MSDSTLLARKPVQIGSIPTSAKETVRFRLIDRGGQHLLDARLFDRGDFPTKQGWSVQVEHLPAVLDAIKAAILEAARLGALAPDLVPLDLRHFTDPQQLAAPRRRARAAS